MLFLQELVITPLEILLKPPQQIFELLVARKGLIQFFIGLVQIFQQGMLDSNISTLALKRLMAISLMQPLFEPFAEWQFNKRALQCTL